MDQFSPEALPSRAEDATTTETADARAPTPIDAHEPSTSTAAAEGTSATAPHSLDRELDQIVQSLGQVGASLGGWWGNVRKQGTTALESSRRELEAFNEKAKRDLAPLIDQARGELNKFGEQARNSMVAGQTAAVTDAPSPTESSNPTGSPRVSTDGTPAIAFYGDVMTPAVDTPDTAPGEPLTIPAASALFNRLQSQISANPNLAHISRTLPNFQQLQSQVQSQLSKLPNTSEAQRVAETYLHRSEAILEKAGKDLGTFLNQAVRVVPPSEATISRRDERRQQAFTAAAGRKEVLLRRLRSESALMLVDPAAPPQSVQDGSELQPRTDTREAFAKFLQSIEIDGGLEGEAWQKRVTDELALAEDEGSPLKATVEAVVPSKLTAEAFWARYFFRAQQINEDEQRRRQVIEGAGQQGDDDFNWDEEDEGEETPVKGKSVTAPSESGDTESWAGVSSAGPSKAPSPRSSVVGPRSPVKERESPRNSSEEGTTSSYDIVSRNASGSEADSKVKTLSTTEEADDGDDSDWE